MELLPDPKFRDAIYRQAEQTPESLDKEMGELSEGELICMRLGWTLEEVNLTRLWLTFNDNRLPQRDDYMAFRKKRSEYFQQRLKRIYEGSLPAKKLSRRRPFGRTPDLSRSGLENPSVDGPATESLPCHELLSRDAYENLMEELNGFPHSS